MFEPIIYRYLQYTIAHSWSENQVQAIRKTDESSMISLTKIMGH